MNTLQRYLVLNVNYRVHTDGTITYDVETSPQIDPAYISHPTFLELRSVKVGQIYTIELLDNIPKWTLVDHNNTFNGNTIEVADLTVCPACGNPLSHVAGIRFCVDPLCLPRQRTCIHKFLHYSVPLSTMEKQAIDALIGFRIHLPSDLMSLTETDFHHLDFPLTRLKPDELVIKFKGISMSLDQFMMSLNVPNKVMTVLDVKNTFDTFGTINDFIDWCSCVHAGRLDTSSDLRSVLSGYFNNAFNFREVTTLKYLNILK